MIKRLFTMPGFYLGFVLMLMVVGYAIDKANAQAGGPIPGPGVSVIAPTILNQSTSNSYSFRGALATGVRTITFPTPYATTPVCVSTEEGANAYSVRNSSISNTAVTITSSTTAGNSDNVSTTCTGNPN